MPKYDYKCDKCIITFEVAHPMGETMDFHECIDENCDGLLHKVFSATPGHFKGQGWGKTYREYKPKKTS